MRPTTSVFNLGPGVSAPVTGVTLGVEEDVTSRIRSITLHNTDDTDSVYIMLNVECGDTINLAAVGGSDITQNVSAMLVSGGVGDLVAPDDISDEGNDKEGTLERYRVVDDHTGRLIEAVVVMDVALVPEEIIEGTNWSAKLGKVYTVLPTFPKKPTTYSQVSASYVRGAGIRLMPGGSVTLTSSEVYTGKNGIERVALVAAANASEPVLVTGGANTVH